MVVFFAKSDGLTLRPSSKAAQIVMASIPQGVPLRIEAKQPRNGRFHRLAWAFFTYVADALNDGPTATAWTPDGVLDLLKIATGHVTYAKLTAKDAARLGVTDVVMPKSISFSSLDEDAFGKFMDQAMHYVRDTLAPWIEDSPHWPEIQVILRESGL